MAADDYFWQLCEFLLDRLDEADASRYVSIDLVAAQRKLVTHAMVRVAVAEDEAAPEVLYDVLKTLADLYADHPGFRDEWVVRLDHRA